MAVKHSLESDCFRILLVSTADLAGGAEISAWNLFNTYRRYGYKSWLTVGNKRTEDPDVLLIPRDSYRNSWAKFWIGVGNKLASVTQDRRGFTRLQNLFYVIGEPRRWVECRRGHEDFHFPGSWRLLEEAQSIDIVHCFNLHGGYFDLRVLPRLSRQRPVILDLRDAWLLSGHCAHSFGCERWKTGCGECPDLSIYPAIGWDGTAYNWRRKRDIYAQSQVYVSTPCQWLMRKVEQSMLAPAIIESRVIPTGVDLTIFHPTDKAAVRSVLGLPNHAKILLFAANGVRRNPWKDYETLKAAIASIGKHSSGCEIHFIALGDNGPSEEVAGVQLHFVPHQVSAEAVARFYQAADVYVHAAKADTFPRVVLEALACGTPVVATAVGGIAEQVKALDTPGSTARGFETYSVKEATGILVEVGEVEGIASNIERLLRNDQLRHRLSANAKADVLDRFDLRKQAGLYLAWYRSILENQRVSAAAKTRKLPSTTGAALDQI